LTGQSDSGRIGLFGGCFDPIHSGHLAAAEDVLEALGLDRVVFVPTGVPPHKTDGTHAPAADRLAMARLAVEGRPRLAVSDVETRREGISYTVDTLRELRRELGEGVRLLLMIGTDAVRILPTWREVSEVFRLAEPVVIARPGDAAFDPSDFAEMFPEALASRLAGSLVHLKRGIEVSSTDIRSRIGGGEPPLALAGGLLPLAVARYIHERGLYRARTLGGRSGA